MWPFKKKVQKDVALDLTVKPEHEVYHEGMDIQRLLWGFNRVLLNEPRSWRVATLYERMEFKKYIDQIVLKRANRNDMILYSVLLTLQACEES